MCYNGQLVMEFDVEMVARNTAMINKLKRLWAARRDIHSASAFARPFWPMFTAEDPENVNELQWGLIPSWVKEDPKDFLKKAPTYNAISETAFEKPSFRAAMKAGRRCVIPMTGFYEWHHLNKQTFPHFIHLKSTPVFFLAGIYEGNTFSILTTEANATMAYIHNTKKRMPVILPPGEEETWLRAGLDRAEVLAMCRPLADEELEAWPISRRITSRSEDPNVPQVNERVVYPELQPPSPSLF